MTRPRLVVVIGANGAGKTTWVGARREALPKPFFNADSIALGLGDHNDPNLQSAARTLVDDLIELELQKRGSFGFESTYSGQSRPNIVRRARQLGYHTRAIFIGTTTHEINIERVRQRVLEGGHDVDDHEVRRRWKDALGNLANTWEAFDAILVIDNSKDRARSVGAKHGRHVTRAGDAPAWTQQLPALAQSGQDAAEPSR